MTHLAARLAVGLLKVAALSATAFAVSFLACLSAAPAIERRTLHI